MRARVPADQVTEGIGDRLGEDLRHPDGQRRAERVPQASRVLDGDVSLLAGDPHLQRAAGRDQLVQPGLRHTPGGGFRGGQIADDAEQVAGAVEVPGMPVGGQPLQLRLDLRHRLRVEQLAQLRAAEEFGEQAGVEGERLRTPFGQRGVALVDELSDVPEQQRLGEG